MSKDKDATRNNLITVVFIIILIAIVGGMSYVIGGGIKAIIDYFVFKEASEDKYEKVEARVNLANNEDEDIIPKGTKGVVFVVEEDKIFVLFFLQNNTISVASFDKQLYEQCVKELN